MAFPLNRVGYQVLFMDPKLQVRKMNMHFERKKNEKCECEECLAAGRGDQLLAFGS